MSELPLSLTDGLLPGSCLHSGFPPTAASHVCCSTILCTPFSILLGLPLLLPLSNGSSGRTPPSSSFTSPCGVGPWGLTHLSLLSLPNAETVEKKRLTKAREVDMAASLATGYLDNMVLHVGPEGLSTTPSPRCLPCL